MLRFIDVNEKTFNTVFDKMKTAFPYEERRDYSDQKECLENKYFKFFEIYDCDLAVGFTALWVFENFVFIEHIAIDENKRGGGYGSKAIELIKEKYNKPLILEAEEKRDNPKDFISFVNEQARYEKYKQDEVVLDKMFEQTKYMPPIEALARKIATEILDTYELGVEKVVQTVTEKVRGFQPERVR